MYKILKSSITLLITALLFSCFSSENGGSTKFSVNRGNGDVEMLMNSNYSLYVTINPSTPGYNDSNFKKTITASIISKNEDDNTGEPIISLSRNTINFSTYLTNSSISISTKQASGAVKIKFSVNGEPSSAQIITVNVSSLDISINGDSATMDSPLYVYSKDPSKNSAEVDMPVVIKIFKKDATNIGPFHVTAEINSDPDSQVTIAATDNKTSADWELITPDSNGYYTQAFELTYNSAALTPDMTVTISIVDKSKKGSNLYFTKRILSIQPPSTFATDIANAVINNNHTIFLTEHEGHVDVPIQLLMLNYHDYEVSPDKKFQVTVYSPSDSGVNLISADGNEAVSELNFVAHDRETKYFTLDAISVPISRNPQLMVKVVSEDDPTGRTFKALLTVLPQKGRDHIIINNRYDTSTPLLLPQKSGVISVYIADNNFLDSGDLSGYSIKSSSDSALKFSNSTNFSLKPPHTVQYIRYDITTLSSTNSAISKDQNNKIQISKNNTVVYSQPTVYLVNPLILNNIIKTDKAGTGHIETHQLSNTLDVVKGTNYFYSYNPFQIAVITAPLKNAPEDTNTFSKALFSLVGKGNQLMVYQLCPTCNSNGNGNNKIIISSPGTAPQEFTAFPISYQENSYDMYLDMLVLDQHIRQKLKINQFQISTDFRLLAKKSNNLIPSESDHNSLFLMNNISTDFTISLDTIKSTNNLVVPLKISSSIPNANLTIEQKDCYFYNSSTRSLVLTTDHRSCTFTISNPNLSSDSKPTIADFSLDTAGNPSKLFNIDIYSCNEKLSVTNSDDVSLERYLKNPTIKSKYTDFSLGSDFKIYQQSPYKFDYSSNGCAKQAKDHNIEYAVRLGVAHDVENETPRSYIWTQVGEPGFNTPNTRGIEDKNFYCPTGCSVNLMSSYKDCESNDFTCKTNNGKFSFTEADIIPYGKSNTHAACDQGKICYAYYPISPGVVEQIITNASLEVTVNGSTISPQKSEDIKNDFFPKINPIPFK